MGKNSFRIQKGTLAKSTPNLSFVFPSLFPKIKPGVSFMAKKGIFMTFGGNARQSGRI
jgi:hypothetical protein